ncbi:MAG TPA: DUF480 domain-containing protein, partial [Thermoanaerobaculia bacterium]
AEDEPLVMELPRRPGQKEARWTHLIGEASPEPEPEEVFEGIADPSASPRAALASRVERLEEVVERLAAELAELKRQLGV